MEAQVIPKVAGIVARTGNRALEFLAAITLILMMLHVVANALLRSFANSPITGTNEYVGYWYLPLVAFIGFVAAQRRDEHIEARLVFDRLPKRNQREIDVFGLLLAGAAYLAFGWYGGLEAVDGFQIGLTGGVTGVVIWPVTFVVPFAFAILGVLVLFEAVAVARGTREPGVHADPVDDPDAAIANQGERGLPQ